MWLLKIACNTDLGPKKIGCMISKGQFFATKNMFLARTNYTKNYASKIYQKPT